MLLLMLPAMRAMAADQPQMIEAGGRFGAVTVYRPAGPVRSFVLFISGDGGWNLGVVDMARHLTEQGAIVVGIDIRHYLAQLGRSTQSCVSLAADFELLSHDVQKDLALPGYLEPVLVGYSSGATLAYAALAQAPTGTFAGAISLGFCPDQDFRGKALCPGSGLHYTVNRHGDFVLQPQPQLEDRWIAMQGQIDQVCDAAAVDAFAAPMANARVERLPKVGHGFSVEPNWLPQFRAAFLQLTAAASPPVPHEAAQLPDLPLIEVPAASAAAGAADTFAILITGDGGWAGLDRGIAKEFAARGIPVVGLDSLRYFWKARTPEGTARDLAAIITSYQQRWHRSEVHLIGYSFGADVLPFVVNRLPPALVAQVHTVTLVAPSDSATFEIHVSNWLPGVTTAGLATRPELARMPVAPLCIRGEGEGESPCAGLPGAETGLIGSGHHLGGDAASIVARILQPRRAAACAGKVPCG